MIVSDTPAHLGVYCEAQLAIVWFWFMIFEYSKLLHYLQSLLIVTRKENPNLNALLDSECFTYLFSYIFENCLKKIGKKNGEQN